MRGRKPPTLTGQAANHLVAVYTDKGKLVYAFFNSKKGEWSTNPDKEKALERSIKFNGDAPDWRPPSEFSKEGYTLATNKENVGNESAPSNQLVPREDPQSPLQSTPASQASGTTEVLSPMRPSPARRIASGLQEVATQLSSGAVNKLESLVGSMKKIEASMFQKMEKMEASMKGMFHTSEQNNVARHEENQERARDVANKIANAETKQDAENAANAEERRAQAEERRAQEGERTAQEGERRAQEGERRAQEGERIAQAEERTAQAAWREEQYKEGVKQRQEAELAEAERLEEEEQRHQEKMADKKRKLAAKKAEAEQTELFRLTVKEKFSNLEAMIEELLTQTKTALESGLKNMADQLLKFGLLEKLEANQAAEKEVEEQAVEATPKKNSKASAEEKKGSSRMTRSRGLAAEASGKPVADARRKPSAPTSRKPAAPAKRAPVAAPVAEIEVMSKTSPSMAAQTFGQLISTLLSINHDDWSKKVDGLLYGIFEHLERANKVGKVEAALVRLQPSLKKVIKAAEGQVVMAALTTIGKLAEKYAPHFTPTAEAILADIIVRSADTGSVNIAEAAMQTAVCVVVNAPTTNMVEIIEKLLLDEKMQKKPKACACMAVLLGQLAVHIDEPQYEQTNPLHGIICDHLRRRLLDHRNEEVRRKTEAAIGLVATTSNGENYALGVVSLLEDDKDKVKQVDRLNKVIAQAQAEAKRLGKAKAEEPRRAGEAGPSSAAGDLE